MDFTGKRVLVTGGTRGIGRAAVDGFLKYGARVAVNGRTEDSVAQALADLDAGDRVIGAPGDLVNLAGCEAAVTQALEGLGGLDVLVNNAGVGEGAAIETADEAHWDWMNAINLKSYYFCSKYALAALRASGGNIVNIASVLGAIGHMGTATIYSATKAGVLGMTRAMALELVPDVRVNAVCPGYLNTDMIRDDARLKGPEVYDWINGWTPMGRIGRQDEATGAILYLASDELASYVTGTHLLVDGGSAAGH